MTVGQALAADTAAVAVLDGPMFHKCAGQPNSYSTYTCGVPDYMHKDSSRNVNIPSRNVTRGITLSVNAAGQVTMQRGANAAADAAVAVQVRLCVGVFKTVSCFGCSIVFVMSMKLT